MKFSFLILAIILVLSFPALTGCVAAGGIFKSGVGVGIFICVVIAALVIFAISKMGNNK